MADGSLRPAPIWDDVSTLRAETLAGLDVDIITGGFPCQDISLAGARAGLAGERSGLYREIIRLTAELRPAFVFLENVAAIRKHASVVVGDLAALGFDCRWTTLSAAEVGANHKRDRWWLLAANADRLAIRKQPERIEQLAPIGGHAEPTDARRAWRGEQALADTDTSGQPRVRAGHDDDRGDACWREPDGSFALRDWPTWGPPFPAIRGVDDGVSKKLERLAALGNAIVPRAGRQAFQYLMWGPQISDQERTK